MEYKVYIDFLDSSTNKDILNWMYGLKWRDGQIRLGSSDSDIRTSKVYFGIEERFKNKLIDQIKKHIPKIKDHEFQLTMNSNRDFYKPHPDTADNIKNKTVSSRKWTLVYYVFKEDNPFTGGDLIIYDKHKTELYDENKYEKITPCNNMLVYFESEYWHEVLPIINDGILENNRFTINIWTH